LADILARHRPAIEAAIRGTTEGTLDVERLAEALHDAMCDVSHHDRPPARCSRWAKYPNIAASVVPRYTALRGQPSETDA
jgi:hypothetical protein